MFIFIGCFIFGIFLERINSKDFFFSVSVHLFVFIEDQNFIKLIYEIFSRWTNKYALRLKCSANLSECDQGSCDLGFAVTPSTKVCQQCTQGCSKCNGSFISQCFECSIGFRLSQGKCTNCSYNCDECSFTSCTKCAKGFRLVSNQCVQKCIFPCLTCPNTNSSQCLSGYGGYLLNSTSQCAQVICPSECAVCPQKYVLKDKKCQQCTADSNCRKCSKSNQTFCKSCLKGFYPKDGVCTQCSTNCEQCNSVGRCTSCKNRFLIKKIGTMKTGICVNCDENCKTCRRFTTSCTECEDGYQLQDFKCISTKNVGFNIIVSDIVIVFMSRIRIFRTMILSIIGGSFEGKVRRITLTSIVEGSTNVQGTVTVPPQENQQSVFSSLSSGQTNGAAIGEFKINSASVRANGFSPQSPQLSENNNLLIIILGVTIPLVLIVVIIGIVCYKIKSKKTEEKQTQNNKVETDIKLSQNEIQQKI